MNPAASTYSSTTRVSPAPAFRNRKHNKPTPINTNLRAAPPSPTIDPVVVDPSRRLNDNMNNNNSSNVNNKNAIEIIPNRFYFMSSTQPPKHDEKTFFFCTDKDLVYQPFFKEFGPLNLSQIYRYVMHVEKVLKQQQYASCQLYHYSPISDNSLRTNAIFLVCCFQMISLKRSAEESWQPFASISPAPQPYKDIHEFPYDMTILDCLYGLEKAIRLGWFSMESFNLIQYQRMYLFENGDMNWIIPNKFLAFSNPAASEFDKSGRRRCTIEEVVPRFKSLSIERVVRLNSEEYEADTFIENGIAHTDLYFTDGSSPPDDIVLKFLKVTENTPGRIAVHCKAGLGRTGTLIGCYAMKHYQFPARAFIGWIRMCRPGSIHGPQNEFLTEKQQWLFSMNPSSNSPQKKEQIRSIAVKRANSNLPNISGQQHTPELPSRVRKTAMNDAISRLRSISLSDNKALPEIRKDTTRNGFSINSRISSSSQKQNLFKSGIFTLNSAYA